MTDNVTQKDKPGEPDIIEILGLREDGATRKILAKLAARDLLKKTFARDKDYGQETVALQQTLNGGIIPPQNFEDWVREKYGPAYNIYGSDKLK